MGRLDLRGGLWLGLAAAALLLAGAMARAGLGVSGGSVTLPALLVAGIGLSLLRRPDWPPALATLAEAIELVALFGGVALAGELASYCVAARTAGFVDAELAAMDGALGFDWLAAYRLVHGHPLLAALARAAYLSMLVSPVLLLPGLAAAGAGDHARRFILAYGLALAVTLAGLAWFPAVSAGRHHLPGAAFDEALVMANHVPVMLGLRAGTFDTIPLGDLRGLITFPSFHAASGLLFIWGCWPLRRLRWPLAAMNLGMIGATPVVGSHYLVDVLAGLLVALLAVLVVRGRYAATASTTFPTWAPTSR